MAILLRQAIKVGGYVLKQRFTGVKQYPLVLMLEPLFRCNLECAGCGKIQYPEEVLKKVLTPEQCFNAVDECGVPIVTIAGGEPLIHPQIDVITNGIVKRKKFVYLCTNAILLERMIDKFKPSPYLTFSIHIDGMKKRHDEMVCREGVFDVAVKAIKTAKQLGFRITTNTTIFDGEVPEHLHEMFDYLTELGVDGMMISPGYSYAWAPDQDHFLKRSKTKALFKEILAPVKTKRGKKWKFNHSSFFLQFLIGERDYECTPWGNPNYNVFGWQKPCYLLNEGYVQTFEELLKSTEWDKYGHKSSNPKCADCMVHCGYEPTAVLDATSSFKNMISSVLPLK